MKVLITDDSRATRTILRRMVEGLGHEVVEAENGAEGLGQLLLHQFDLALVDWNMPKVNGLQLIRRIREVPPIAHLPVILVTDEYIQEKIDAAMAAGASGYLAKPFEPDALVEMLAHLGLEAA